MFEDGRQAFIDICYLISAFLLILSIRQLSSARTARTGNLLAMAGMGLAIFATFFVEGVLDAIVWIVLAIIVGGGAGYFAAKRVQMTQMPQMVAIFNGLGGGTAALVSVGEFLNRDSVGTGEEISIILGTLIGALTLTGSLVAFAKLQGLISGRPIVYANQQLYNAAVFVVMLAIGVAILLLGEGTTDKSLLVVLFLLSLVIGVTLVLPTSPLGSISF